MLFGIAARQARIWDRRRSDRVGPMWHDRPFAELAGFWKRRWAVPRSERTGAWKEFDSGKFFRGVRRGLAKAG